MAKSLKELMSMQEVELIGLGAQFGLTFHMGMRKRDMVQQLNASVASGWMETNSQLMQETPTADDGVGYGDSSQISDAAHIAQMISGAGFTETFNDAMSGGRNHHVEAIHSYMQQLGVSSDDVWMHMPKSNPNIPAGHFGQLNAYMRDTLQGHQDIMPQIPGHYAGDIMGEYATTRGDIAKSFGYLAHMYVDREQYQNPDQYARDIYRVAKRLEGSLPDSFKEVGYAAATGGSNNHTSYMDALPRLGDPSIVRGIENPRAPLNASGLPMGSMGSGINPEYSLSASLTGTPGWSEQSKGMFANIAAVTKSAASVYAGQTGMRSFTMAEQSNYERIMDAATRSMDLDSAREAFAQLNEEVMDTTHRAVGLMTGTARTDADNELRIPSIAQTGTDFAARMGDASNFNVGRSRREAKNPVQYHKSLEQGTDEWLAFRRDYDITGSTVGDYLGHNPATNNSPLHTMGEKIGLTQRKDSPRSRENFERGHRLEAWARPRVAEQFGVDISEVGAITNRNYPGMMYSPDGLIGDDALWEHKAPNNFKDLATTPNYMDQMQLGMHLSGRSRTLFTQTVGEESRSQWVEADPNWFEQNQNKIYSSMARMEAGRKFMAENADLEKKDLINQTRAAMSGDGIWGYSTRDTGPDRLYTAGKRGMAKHSPTAGTGNDQFLDNRTQTPDADFENPERLALAVKQGILGAQEETRQKQQATGGLMDPSASPFQPQFGPAPSANEAFDSMMRRAGYGEGYMGGGGRGNGGGGGGGESWGPAGDAFRRGIDGGSISSMSSGALNALGMTPMGRAAITAIGAVKIGAEAIDTMNDFYGEALDAGVINPNEYSSQSQGLEMLGMNTQQANRANRVTHSAYNTMLNGDPSGAVNIVRGTRGLITIGDIRQTQGDPVALARIMQERGQARGWSQARIAGAAEMAGLDGFARTYDRTSYSHGEAAETVQRGRESDFADGTAQLGIARTESSALSISRNVPQGVISYGAPIIEGMGDAARGVRTGIDTATSAGRNVYDFIERVESGGRDFNADGSVVTSTTGAKGRMQVLDSTLRDPGFGVTPARDDSLEERSRVGRDYYDALLKRYGSHEKAMAAYTDGAGTLDKALEQHGSDWLSAMPAQAQKRVKDYQDWVKNSGSISEGATGFTRNGMSYGQTSGTTVVQVNINAKVNGREAQATVSTPQGQTVSQQVNVGNGTMERR